MPTFDLSKNMESEDVTTAEIDALTEKANTQDGDEREEVVSPLDIPAPSPRELFTGATEQPASADETEHPRPAAPPPSRNPYETDDTLPWEKPDETDE